MNIMDKKSLKQIEELLDRKLEPIKTDIKGIMRVLTDTMLETDKLNERMGNVEQRTDCMESEIKGINGTMAEQDIELERLLKYGPVLNSEQVFLDKRVKRIEDKVGIKYKNGYPVDD